MTDPPVSMAGKRPARLVGVAVLLGMIANPARAQEVELWSFLGSASLTRSTNLFLTPSEGTAENIGGLTLSLNYLRSGERSRVSASFWAIGLGFQELDQLNTVNAGFHLDGSYSFTRDSRLRYTQSVAQGFNPERLYGRGALLPQLNVTSSVTRLVYSWDASPSTSLDLTGDVDWLRWTSDTAVSTPQLTVETFPEEAALGGGLEEGQEPPLLVAPDGTLFTVNLVSLEGVLTRRLSLLTGRLGTSVSHDFSAKTRGDVDIAYRESRFETEAAGLVSEGRTGLVELGGRLQRDFGDTTRGALRYTQQRATRRPFVNTHNLVASVDKEWTERFQMDGALGVSYVDGDGDTTSSWGWVGDLGASLRFKRGWGLARVSRSVYQALGFGRVLTTDFAYVSGSFVPAERLLVGAYGGWRHTSDSLDRDFAFDNAFVGVFASWRHWERTSLSGYWAWRHYDFDPFPGVSGSVVGVSISYARAWK